LTPPALVKQIGLLQKELGVALVDTNHQGVTLTPAASEFVEACLSHLDGIDLAMRQIQASTARPTGTLTIGGVQAFLDLLAPHFPRFLAQNPEIRFDVRSVSTKAQIRAAHQEILLLQGWPEVPDRVRKIIAAGRLITCASPEYWRRHPTPQHPSEIEAHNALLFAHYDGELNDMWRYQKGSEIVTVVMRGNYISDIRSFTLNHALAGRGVVRTTDIHVNHYLASRQLIQVLADWTMLDAAPLGIYTAPAAKRAARVNAFVDFTTNVFSGLQSGHPAMPHDIPFWHGTHPKASDVLKRPHD
jgi:DNA-binding transcriptional LysR family regulator